MLELVYTAHDLAPFAADLGYTGPPFRWDERRRLQIRCELDAAFFHLYGVSRDDTAYILDTFPIVRDREQDPKKYGEYLSKRLILETYDALAAAGPAHPWTSPLVPLPGDLAAAHPAPEAPEPLAELLPLFPESPPMTAMLTRLRVAGYRSVAEVDLRLQRLSVLVGPNGAGKTNLTRAWALLGEILERGSIEPIDLGALLTRRKGELAPALRLGADVRLRVGDGADDPPWLIASLDLEIRGQAPAQDPDAEADPYDADPADRGARAFDLVPVIHSERLRLWVEDLPGAALDLAVTEGFAQVRVDPEAEALAWVFAPDLRRDLRGPALHDELVRRLAPGSMAVSERGRPILRLLNVKRHFSPFLDELVARAQVHRIRPEVGAMRELSDFKATLGAPGYGLAAAVRALRGARAPSQAFQDDVLDVQRAVFPDVSDVATRLLAGNRLELLVEDAAVGGALSPEELSDGFMHLLAMLVAVADRRKCALVIEEPENAVHPWVLHLLMEHFAAQEGRQILLTTHSPVLVDELADPAGLLIAEHDAQRGTSVTPAPTREHALDRILTESGLRLGELWRGGFVGGLPSRWSAE